MPIIATSTGDSPADRIATYREHQVAHWILLVPFDSLSSLQQQVALALAAEWGRDLAELEDARRDLLHTPPEERSRPLAGLWMLRLLDGPYHLLDGEYWVEEVERWHSGSGTDPRLGAFCSAWSEAAPTLPAVRDPGPHCGCPACNKRWGTHKRRQRKRR